MKAVQTVTGLVSTEKLGSVLMHEHIFTSGLGIWAVYPQFYREDYMEFALSELKEMKENGIDTVVDATPPCLGRDVRHLREVSIKSGVNLIATTGWWSAECPLNDFPDEKWAQCFIDDLTKGCDGTDIKAGILKAAMDREGLTPWRKKIHRAVGMASITTGAKIMLHSYCPMETPRHQLRWLREVGVDMSKVIVGHIPETTDLDFVKWIYDQGVWLGIDRLPIIQFPWQYAVATSTRIKFVKTLLDEGMGDRMLFSHDLMSVSTLFDNQPKEIRDHFASLCPDRFLFLKNNVFPKLIELGVDADILWNYTIENPRRFFEGE